MDDSIVGLRVVLLVKQNSLHIGIHDLVYMLFLQYGITIQDDFISFNRNYFSGIFVHKILVPGIQHAGRKFTSQYFLLSGLGNFYFLGEVKDFKNILVTLKSNGAEQGSYR